MQRMQNRCARICTKTFDYNTSSATLIKKKLNWMNIETRHKYFVGIRMYKYSNDILPSLSSNFSFSKSVPNHYTRSAAQNNLAIPLVHTDSLNRNLYFIGPKCWNSIPCNICNVSSLYHFKYLYKKYLLTDSIT